MSIESLTPQTVLNWLVTNGYAKVINSKILLSSKFTKELNLDAVSAVKEKLDVKDDGELFMQFLKEVKKACVQLSKNEHLRESDFTYSRGENRYMVLSYTKTAVDEFIKIVKGGVDLNRLVNATAYYYLQNDYPQTIKNFLCDGTWRSIYEDFEMPIIRRSDEY